MLRGYLGKIGIRVVPHLIGMELHSYGSPHSPRLSWCLLAAISLTFINTVRKVGLDVRFRYPVLYKTRVAIAFRIFLTKIEDGVHNFRNHRRRARKVRLREGI